MRNKFFGLLNGVRSDAAEHIAKPGERIDLFSSQEVMKVHRIAMVFPPRSLPRNVQLVRPTAMPRK